MAYYEILPGVPTYSLVELLIAILGMVVLFQLVRLTLKLRRSKHYSTFVLISIGAALLESSSILLVIYSISNTVPLNMIQLVASAGGFICILSGVHKGFVKQSVEDGVKQDA